MCWNSYVATLNQHLENRSAMVWLCSVAIYDHLKLGKYALWANEWAILEKIQLVLHVSYTDTATSELIEKIINIALGFQVCN